MVPLCYRLAPRKCLNNWPPRDTEISPFIPVLSNHWAEGGWAHICVCSPHGGPEKSEEIGNGQGLQGDSKTPSARLQKAPDVMEGCYYLQDVSPRNSLTPNEIRKCTTNQVKILLWMSSETANNSHVSTVFGIRQAHYQGSLYSIYLTQVFITPPPENPSDSSYYFYFIYKDTEARSDVICESHS